MELAHISARKFELSIKLVMHLATIAGWLTGIYFCIQGLTPLILAGKSDELNALSRLVEALRPGSTFGYILFLVTLFLYRVERHSKKRAIAEKAKWQKKAEANEPNRTSSNLTSTGDTPRTED